MNSAAAEEENPAVFAGRHVHQHGFIFQQRVGLREYLTLSDVTDDRAVAPGVIAFNRYTALKDKPHPLRDCTRDQERFTFLKALLMRFQHLQSLGDFEFCHPTEKHGLLKLPRIHLYFSNLF